MSLCCSKREKSEAIAYENVHESWAEQIILMFSQTAATQVRPHIRLPSDIKLTRFSSNSPLLPLVFHSSAFIFAFLNHVRVVSVNSWVLIMSNSCNFSTLQEVQRWAVRKKWKKNFSLCKTSALWGTMENFPPSAKWLNGAGEKNWKWKNSFPYNLIFKLKTKKFSMCCNFCSSKRVEGVGYVRSNFRVQDGISQPLEPPLRTPN